MAQQLTNTSQENQVLAREVLLAKSFIERTLGLMGKRALPFDQTLLIKGSKLVGCNSVHTCFMRFPIDVVFVDDDLKVRSIVRGLKPWRMTWPTLGAVSAFEFTAGALSPTLKVGDRLHVGD